MPLFATQLHCTSRTPRSARGRRHSHCLLRRGGRYFPFCPFPSRSAHKPLLRRYNIPRKGVKCMNGDDENLAEDGRRSPAEKSNLAQFFAFFFPVTVKLWKTERNSKNGLPKWDAPFHRLHQLTFKSSNLIQNRRPRARFRGRESLKESVKSWIRSIQLIRNGLKFRKRRQKVFKPQFDQGKTITNILQQILPTTQ